MKIAVSFKFLILSIIILLGLLIRVIYFISYGNYRSIDGYLPIARVLYESNSFGLDKLAYSENEYSQTFIEEKFKNERNPIILKNDKEIILTAILPLGWPAQIVMIYHIFGKNNVKAILIYNIILSTGTIFLFFIIGIKLFNVKIGLFAALLSSINPQFIHYTSWTLTETSFLFLLMLTIYTIIVAYEIQKKSYYALSGILLGLTSYVRPVGFIILLVLLTFLILSKKFKIQNLFVFSIAFLSILSPWIIRNYLIFNKFIPMTTLGGLVFVQGNNWEVYNDKSGGSKFSVAESLVTKNADKTEIEINNLAFKNGMDFIKKCSIYSLCKLELYKIRYGFGGNIIKLIKEGQYKWLIINYSFYYFISFFSLFYYFFFYFKTSRLYPNMFLFNIFISTLLSLFLIQTLVYYAQPRYRAFVFEPMLIYSACLAINAIASLCCKMLVKKRHGFTVPRTRLTKLFYECVLRCNLPDLSG